MDNNENKGIWIPFEIWELADLSPMQRILLAKIHSLSHKDGSCWAGDEYLAETLVCTPQYIRKMRKDLCETHYLACEGYGHKRKMTVIIEATIGTSNERNKQLQLQKKQQSLQKKQPQLQLEATTVAHTIDVTIEKNKEQLKRSRFSPPSIEECMDKFEKAGSSTDEGEKFHNFYESKGWLVGKSKMKNWEAAARNWIKRNNDEQRTTTTKAPSRDQLENYLKHGTI